ncbi:MAG TPA: CRISPR-associated endonuclease Cas1, partial [Bacteroidales bacterium]
MFTHKDIEYRSVFVINCIEERALRVMNGELLLEDTEANKTLTKLPFQKILALFVVGHITITTPLIDKCTKFGIPVVVMKPNFRPVFFFSVTAEANFLLRQK